MLASLFTTLTLSALALAAPQTKRQQAQVVYSCTKPNTAALTFDDGPYQYLYDMVNTLNDNGAKGTFFFNGDNWGCIYDGDNQWRVKYAYENGHQVASHTWSHPHMNSLTWDQIHDEMWRVELALQRIIGVVPAFVRPPYGEFNDMVRDAAYIRGQTIAIWDFDSGDAVGRSADETKGDYSRIASQHPNNILTLNHEVQASSAYDVLPHAIWALKNAGYELVTLAECLDMQPYQSVGAYGTPDASWTC